jgi:hypothetical protein
LSGDADAELDGQGDERESGGDSNVVKHVAVRRNLFETLKQNCFAINYMQ